ncbi:hypothetical protein NDU88_002951 [Pleurodeles waltl]|uniref:Uncharacterized protein n=1 Tax=Pleurodeles waltl TaxID=8319 RepID=A0AAV7T3T1_PLEWA|nr:hypothetical protein NDU88_002951 [Pleurodeles waltl]
MLGAHRHPTTTLAPRTVRGEDRRPILGLRPRRIKETARGRRKGPPRGPRHSTLAAASPAARPGDVAGRRSATVSFR